MNRVGSFINRYDPCKFIGDTLAAYITDTTLAEKIRLVAVSVFTSLAAWGISAMKAAPMSALGVVSLGCCMVVAVAAYIGHEILDLRRWAAANPHHPAVAGAQPVP